MAQEVQPEDWLVDAAYRGEIDSVRKLLDSDPKLVDREGNTPVWDGAITPVASAALNGQVEVLELLIDRGAKLDTEPCPTALALAGGHAEAATLLIERGAPIDIKVAAGLEDPTHLDRMLAENPEAAREVFESNDTPLHFAGTPAAVDLLLRHGAELDRRDDYHGCTAFEWAFSAGPHRRAAADRLLELGCDTDVFDAVMLGDLDAVRNALDADPELLERKSHSNHLFARGGPLLHAAGIAGNFEIANLLLDRGADVNSRGQPPMNATALHMAVWGGNLELVRALLERGADPTIADDNFEATPRGWAEFNESDDVLELFDEYGV